MAVAPLTTLALAGASLALSSAPASAPKPKVDRFDAQRAWTWVSRQVALGPRPAGSPASRKLAGQLKTALPRGSFQNVPGGLRNVVGFVRGRNPSRLVVVGAHYDTKELPGFVGADDGASGTAIVVELARTIKPKQLRPSIVFILFDGEELPAGSVNVADALRGSTFAAPKYRKAEAMILLDMVGDRDLRIPRERLSTPKLWARLRAAARRVGAGSVFPNETVGAVGDDHYPFLQLGVPAIDLIDFTFPCWHELCDDKSAVSKRSLDVVGETVYALLRSF